MKRLARTVCETNGATSPKHWLIGLELGFGSRPSYIFGAHTVSLLRGGNMYSRVLRLSCI